MFEFTDEYGVHKHELSIPGRSYNARKPVRCEGCLAMLTARLDAWQVSLSKRYKLPDGFWNGYVRSWEK